MRRLFGASLVIVVIVAGVGLWLTAPQTIDPDDIAGISPDLERGAFVFTAAGCASCHAADGGPDTELGGGMAFPSDFGTFYAPNISPDTAHGIGNWTMADLVNALKFGTGAQGEHLYPALPYGSYTRAKTEDFVHLYAYLMTLPPVDTPSKPHDVGFPFNVRLALGGWKLLFLDDAWVLDPETLDDRERYGQYLVEALGHCGECHTPRNALGGPDRTRWLGGAPNPSGQGRIPNITPGALDWSETDIAYYLESGFTPDFDSVGGHMTAVVEKFAKLEAADREAVAAYLKKVPAVE